MRPTPSIGGFKEKKSHRRDAAKRIETVFHFPCSVIAARAAVYRQMRRHHLGGILYTLRQVRLFYCVRTTLSSRGHVVIPIDVRRKLGLKEGDDFIVLCSSDREILLRPVGHRRKSLLQALRALHGLEFKRQDEPIRDIKLRPLRKSASVKGPIGDLRK